MRSGHLLLRSKHYIFSHCLYWASCLSIVIPGSGMAAELQASEAWVRLAPPAAKVNAAYVSLANPTDQLIVITQVSADCCAMTMLHQTRQEAGTVSMIHLDQLEIPPQTTIQLKPGGLHIMLMRSKKPLVEGDQVQLQLILDDGTVQHITAPVRSSNE